MDPLEQIVLAGQSLARGASEAVRLPLALPWLALLALDLAVIAAFAGFAHPWLSWAMAPALRSLAGEQALHYPAALQGLPDIFSTVAVAIGAVLGAPLFGWSATLLARRFRRQRVGAADAWRETAHRVLPLAVCLVPWWIAFAWVGQACLDSLEDLGSSPMRAVSRLAGAMGVEAALLVIACLMLPVLAVGGPPLPRWGEELERAWRRSGLAAIVTAVGFELALLIARLVGNVTNVRLIGDMVEFIPAAVAVGALVAVVAQLLFCASSVVIYATAIEDEAWREGF